MRSRSPCTIARACSASWRYCSGFAPESASVLNMRRSVAAGYATPAAVPWRPMASLHSIDGPGLYVTGTDTGIGKTLASGALLHAMRAHGLRAVGMKPVASGCERIDGVWKNADALALLDASDPKPRYEDLNPFALPEPLAPELASRDADVEVT